MSTSARRFSSDVTTNRFAWQGHPEPAPSAVEPALRVAPATGPTAVTPALRDLPSPSAERLDLVEREAFARGRADGKREAAAEAEQRLEEVTARLAEAIKELSAVRGVLMRRSERDLVRLAVSMAERILRREVEADREVLVAMARGAIDRLGENAAASIHLNPVDYELVMTRYVPDPGKSVELVADPSVERGGCLVRCSFGAIETGVEAQVRELSKALLGDDADAEGEGFDGPVANA